jgi:hypothetical protein
MLPKSGDDCFEQYGRGVARRSRKYFRAMEFEWSAFRCSIKVSDLLDVSALPINRGSFRRARTKLPKDIKKKLEEWRFASGAAILCLVAYSDGSNVQTFQ